MYNGEKVIDVHGHMSTPPQFRAYAYNLVALRTPGEAGLAMSDDDMRPALERHLHMMDERNIDIQMISPRPIAMMHWERPFLVEHWTQVTNDVIHRQCKRHPGRFFGIAQLPQNAELDTSNCLRELERCVEELGFVGALVNPDPAGDRQTPGMNHEYWYPLYERAQALRVPLIVHPAFSRDRRLDGLPHSYQYNNITEETLATLLLENSDVFDRYPRLKIIVCHCGGALNRQLPPVGSAVGHDAEGKKKIVRASGESVGGQVGITVGQHAQVEAQADVSNSLFFDTCAYDRDFLSTAIKQRGPDRMLFGTEAPGSGSGVINPDTNRPSDDLVPVIDSLEFLSFEDKMKIISTNAKRTFPRLIV